MVGSVATSIYMRSPLWLQNAAISLYGMNLRRLRYGGEFRQRYDELLRLDKARAEQLRDEQNARLRGTIREALASVPFYREHFGLADSAIDTLTVEDLPRALPPLAKSELRRDASRFWVQRPDANVTINTSGSTGSPLSVRATRAAIRTNYAFFARFLHWHGVGPFSESATFAGRIFVGRGRGAQVQYRRNAAFNDTLFSSYHLSNDNLASYARELQRRQPRYIDSYPSSIYRIACYLESEMPDHGIRPQVIVTSSETLLQTQRQVIERVFGCPVRDQYGSAEMVTFVAQCERGSYHIASEYGVLEVIDAAGRPVAPGERGELCLTGFINPAMPLLRYLIGDAGRMATHGCDCGRHSPVLEGIEGRVDDIIVTPSGKHVGRLDPAFKGIEGVRESQILQVEPALCVVRVVEDGTGRFDGDLLTRNLHERLGGDMQIRIEPVDSIEKEANGKLRSVKSLLRRAS